MKKIVLLTTFLILLIGSLYATTNITEVSISQINQDPDPANPGEYVELRFQVNITGTVENMRFQLIPEYPLYFDNSDTAIKETGRLTMYNDEKWFYRLYYKLRVSDDALEDDYKVKLRYNLSDKEQWTEKEYIVRVGDKQRPKLELGTLSTSPKKLVSDIDEAELNIEIQNIGTADAQNVTAELILPEGITPTYGYSNRSNLGTISESQYKTATFYIDTEKYLKSNVYDTNLILKYKEENDEDNIYKEIILPVSILVKNKPIFEITNIETNPEVIAQGNHLELKLTLKNVGDDADSVSIRTFKESSQPFEFDEKSDYIGRLDTNMEGMAIITMDIDKDATPKEYIIDVQIRSIDKEEVITQNESIRINIEENKENNSTFGSSSMIYFLIIIIAIIVIGYIIYYKTRKNESKKK